MSKPKTHLLWILIGVMMLVPGCSSSGSAAPTTYPTPGRIVTVVADLLGVGPPTRTPFLTPAPNYPPLHPTAPVLLPPLTAVPVRPPESYPLRYYPDDAFVSFVLPPGWTATKSSDGRNIAAFADPQSETVYYLASTQMSSRQSLDEASDEFVAVWQNWGGSDFVADDAYSFEDGSAGWRREGRLDNRHWVVVSVASGTQAYHFYTVNEGGDDVVVPPVAPFEALAHTLRAEPAEPLEVARETALVLSGGEPLTLDPALTRSGGSGLMGDLFSGLVVLDPAMRVRPALAERWSVDASGTVYTFYLNPAASFHNGRPLTADDVLFSWERAAHPDTESQTVLLYMGDIVGLAEYRAGEVDSIAGLAVIDERIFQVTIDAPKPYFLAKLTYPVSWVVDRYNVVLPNWEQHPNGSGPFRVRQHIEDSIWVLERNPYYGGPLPQLEHVVYKLSAGSRQRLYENGEVDVAGISKEQLERANMPSDLLYGTVFESRGFCTRYITFNTALAPFDDPLVRRAFVHAIDRERYTEAITNNRSYVGRGLLPPGIPGYSDVVQAPAYDPGLARELLAASSYGSAAALPPVIWTVSSFGGRYSSSVAFLADMWADELGVEIVVEGIDNQSYHDQIDAGEYGHLLSEGWCADYPDPENFLDVLFHSSSAQNNARYNSPAYDALVEQARVEADWVQRLALYNQAEQLLLDDAPALFITHSGPHYEVWKPYVRGFTPGPIGVPQHHLLWIQK